MTVLIVIYKVIPKCRKMLNEFAIKMHLQGSTGHWLLECNTNTLAKHTKTALLPLHQKRFVKTFIKIST